MREKIKYIILFLSYFFYSITIDYLLKVTGINISNKSALIKNIFLFLIDAIYLSIVIIVTYKDLKKDLKNINTNIFSKSLLIYLIGLIFMGISNSIVINITGNELSSNEETVRNLIKIYPVYMFFSSVIYAPIVEETIFRKCFRKIIDNDVFFIIISGIFFGSIHVVSQNNYQILTSIPYIIMGIDFSYIYYKTNNIFSTISIHTFHNLILIIIQYIGG